MLLQMVINYTVILMTQGEIHKSIDKIQHQKVPSSQSEVASDAEVYHTRSDTHTTSLQPLLTNWVTASTCSGCKMHHLYIGK